LPSDTQPVNSPTAQNKTAYLIVPSDISQAAPLEVLVGLVGSFQAGVAAIALAHRLGARPSRRRPTKRSHFLPVALTEVSDLEVARA
jgi:hypothetical protein